ncbi:hypothetical protein PFICI_01116 [Pestalotiopsis fici W106-1]|uniref:Transcription factor domain-containing protein n=1 Tax=Pestalotiopsis fici (strain W106-1 / CGMCC3.15140) TaxID=1229662 RepID=W3XMM2_PESFW|nr:uncharacterized protein PFICI_01116 [Pestalotiopsis fici W106-1]ETS87288.1 hypothetical protein PFICI_01116 [Pestalotiopsis fici W106-1]
MQPLDINDQDVYLDHAFRYTILDLSDSTTNTRFWVDFLPRSLSHIEAIRFALVALAAAHVDFITRKTDGCSSLAATKHERSAILYYNLAIRHLQPLLSKATPENTEAGLACCILFICLENLRGRYAEALKHLQSGVDLLVSMLVSGSERYCLTTRRGRVPVALYKAISSQRQYRQTLGHVFVLFCRLSLETHILTDNEVTSLTTVSQANPDLSRAELESLAPITTLDAARDELHSFEISHDIFYQQTYSNIRSRPSYTNATPTQQPECFLTRFSENDKTAYQHLYKQFWQWSIRFDRYLVERHAHPRSSQDLSKISKIRLLQKTWIAILDEEPWRFSGQSAPILGVLDEFLPEVESIIKLRGPSSRRLFTFGADVIPYITLAGCLTEDLGLLRRIIAALKLLDRREGFWDSNEIAEIFEASILARAEHGANITGSRGILQMASDLLALDTRYLSPTNSISLLAKNTES